MPVRRVPLAVVVVVLASAAAGAAAQPATDARAEVPRPPASTGRTAALASAVRAAHPPVLDGRDADELWRMATPVEGFRQYVPNEDGVPRYATTARVAYDERNLYVFVRAFDAHPDSVRGFLARRDERSGSDELRVMVDSYHDRRTGYEFIVNPAGVKRDASIVNDDDEDLSWDAVWDVATRVDSLGWTAEFRIPLSQLRFSRGESNSFGLAIMREYGRFPERDAWPVYRRSRPGLASQFGTLTGIELASTPRRLEVSPYVVNENASLARSRSPDVFSRDQRARVGGDVKYGVSSNLTLDATINPDFGQVEADPAVLNLGAFETFFAERRPFFVEGNGIFRFDVNCNDGSCTGLFYSRRIGRAPQLAGVDGYADESTPTATTILGAAKLTGRTQHGLSLGFLDAVTQREQGVGGATVEPRANYFVTRLQQDLRDGNTGVGVMLTGVNRATDAWSAPFLRRTAYVGGLDFRHRFAAQRFELSGYAVGSRVEGDTSSIRLTQLGSVHYFQRPDDALGFDPSRTSLAGDAEQVSLSKVAGFTRFNTNYQRLSPGFEINDAGYLRRADQQSVGNWMALRFDRPHAFYQRAQVNFNNWESWNTGGMLTDLGGNVNANATFANNVSGYLGVGAQELGGALDDRASRGGPAVRRSPGAYFFSGLDGDGRKRWIPGVSVYGQRTDAGRSRYVELSPSVELRASSRVRLSLSPSYSINHDDSQWYGNFDVTDTATGATATRYTFARLDQRTLSLSTRLNFTATPTLTFQFYAQPYISRGSYSDLRQLGEARSADYDRRFVPFDFSPPNAVSPVSAAALGGESFSQLRSNSVLRWEYRPGSTIFLVWTQGRQMYDGTNPGTLSVKHDAKDLFALHPENTFLVKASYWFSL